MPTSAAAYGPIAPDEGAAFADLLACSFGVERTTAATWAERGGHANTRALRHGGELVAGLVLVPMGQFFGGRAVPMTGVAAVGVAPPARGEGHGTRLMQTAVEELHERGVALSALYPATLPLYRRAGFEIAGACYRLSAPASLMCSDEGAGGWARVSPARLRVPYRRYAAGRDGWLDRGVYVHERIARGQTWSYAWPMEGEPRAWVTYRHEARPRGYDLRLTDLGSLEPAGWRALAGFLHGHRSLAEEVVWFGGTDDLLLWQLREARAEVRLHCPWMLRVTHVEAALAARGYPPGLSTTLDLEVRDPVLPGNGGRYQLRVAGGRGQVKRGGRGSLCLDVSALAPLFSGHASPQALAALGALSGSAESRARATAIFSGPAPSMPDVF